MRGRKVPDGADAVGDQQITDRLCLFGGDGDNADLDFITAADLGQTAEIHDWLAAFGRAHQCVVCVEGGDDVQPILRKAGIAQQRAAQLSRANQYGIVRVIISEIYLNVLNQAFAVISDLGPSAVADEREILSNLDFTHIQPCGDGRGGNIDRSVGRKRFQIGEIGRQTAKRRPGDFFFYHAEGPFSYQYIDKKYR